jgi:hypothetical protein
MEKPREIFAECPMLGGYTLIVRDDWNFKLKKVNITEKEKAAYEAKYGEELITYDEFMTWWMDFNSLSRPSTQA